MKRKSLTSVSKRIMAGCLSVAMILTGLVIVPKTAEAEEAKKVHYDNTYIMSDYWKSSTKKAPVKDGYVFGGWFTKLDENKAGAEQETGTGNYYAPLKNVEEADNTAFAKFVPAEVLSIKTQKGTIPEDTTKASLRILSTVDSTNYQSVGFYYKLATKEEGKANFTKVYSAIKPYRGANGTQTPGANFVENVSLYFIAADVTPIIADSFSKIVYARPYWITMDGTEVVGLARNSRVVDKDNDYTSVGINLLPQLAEGNLAVVAAGKIQVTYNTDNYDVVGTPDITADNDTIGGKYLFPEMECHVDETKGTITFVGNADIQEGGLKNLLADGLFANVRFEKAADATGDALDFTIQTTEFCNWAEADVKAVVVQ